MSPANAKLVTDGITLLILIYCLLLFLGWIPLKKKNDFLEKNRKIFVWGSSLAICYYVYEVLVDIFKW